MRKIKVSKVRKNKMKKSQIGLEYLLTIGILLVLLMFTANISMKNSRDSVKIQQAQAAIDKISANAGALYNMNTGSYKVIKVRLPKYSRLWVNSTDEGNLLVFNYKVFGTIVGIEKVVGFDIETIATDDLGIYETFKIEKIEDDVAGIDKIIIRRII